MSPEALSRVVQFLRAPLIETFENHEAWEVAIDTLRQRGLDYHANMLEGLVRYHRKRPNSFGHTNINGVKGGAADALQGEAPDRLYGTIQPSLYDDAAAPQFITSATTGERLHPVVRVSERRKPSGGLAFLYHAQYMGYQYSGIDYDHGYVGLKRGRKLPAYARVARRRRTG